MPRCARVLSGRPLRPQLQTWALSGQLAPLGLRSGLTFSIFPMALMGCSAGCANKEGRGRPACLVPTCPSPSCAFGCRDLRALLCLQGPHGPSLSLRPLGQWPGHQGHGKGLTGTESRAVPTRAPTRSSPGLPTVPSPLQTPLLDEAVLPVP